MAQQKRGLFIGKGEKPEEVPPPGYDVHVPKHPHPVEVAISGFFRAWVSAVARTVMVILMILSYLFTAVMLGVTVIGGLIVLLTSVGRDDYWWSYPLLSILGIGMCVLFTRTREWVLTALSDWVDHHL